MGNGTPLGEVRGLGSAKAGAHHWLVQRFTAIGLLVLGVWFVTSLLMLPNLAFITLHDWASHPTETAGLSLLLICAIWHARLGVQVLIEDYVHSDANRFACLAALNLAAFGGAAFGLVCIARIAFGAFA